MRGGQEVFVVRLFVREKSREREREGGREEESLIPGLDSKRSLCLERS